MTTRYETPGAGASMVLLALRLPTGLRRRIGELRYIARGSGRHIALPVGFGLADDCVVIRVGSAATTTWWREFRSPHDASIRVDGRWRNGLAHVVMPDTLAYAQVDAIYRETHRRARLSARDPYVVIDLSPQHISPESARPSLRERWTTR